MKDGNKVESLLKKEIIEWFMKPENKRSLIQTKAYGFLVENAKTKLLQKRQTILNESILNELSYLRDAAEKNNIKFACFKGVCLAYYAYSEPVKRFFNDMDILINPDSLPVLIKILKSRGYKLADNSEITIDNLVQSKYSTHTKGTLKEVSIENEKFYLSLEIHFYYIYDKLYTEKDSEKTLKAVNSGIELKINNKSYYMLNEYNQLLNLISHFYHHFFDDIRKLLMHNTDKLYPNVRILFDIAHMLNKNRDIDVSILYREIIENGMNNQFLLFCKFFNYLFNDSISDIFKRHPIKKIVTTGHELNCRLLVGLLGVDVRLMFSGNYRGYLKEIIGNFRKIAFDVDAVFTKEDYPDNNDIGNRFVIDEGNAENALFKTHIFTSRNSEKIQVSASGNIYWDNEFLKFSIQVNDSKVVFNSDNKSLLHKDSVQISLIGEQFDSELGYLEQIIISAEKTNSKLEIQSISLFRDIEYLNSGIEGVVKLTDNGYIIHAKISWILIGIVPEPEKEMFFDITINNSINKDEGVCEQICLVNVIDGWNPLYCGRIRLKK